MFKNISKYSWFSFIPFVTIALMTVVLFCLGIIPLIYLIASFIGWTLISGLGVAVGYHRIFSHNTHPNLPRWKENIILFFGALSGQGSSITWSALHRGYHHRYSDTEKDLHSPVAHGIWHSFFGWALQVTENDNPINMKYAANLLRKKNHIFFHKHYMKILWLVPLAFALINWQFALAAFFLPTGLCLLQDNLVNVFGHKRGLIGYRNFETNDNSQNNVLLGWFGWGQGWHNNHHFDMKPFNLGSGISGKWWEFDPCVIFLPFLGKGK